MLGSGIQDLIDNSVTDDQSGITENLFFWGGGEGEGERGVVIRINLQGYIFVRRNSKAEKRYKYHQNSNNNKPLENST